MATHGTARDLEHSQRGPLSLSLAVLEENVGEPAATALPISYGGICDARDSLTSHGIENFSCHTQIRLASL
jgi:hypothetical protein